MVQSAVINEAIVFITALSLRAVIRRTEEGKLPESFRYFTVLSNLFVALTALILLVCEFFGSERPQVLLSARNPLAGGAALGRPVVLCQLEPSHRVKPI